jgi:dipeptidyl aminopeptidase/acylaminoacyl peptidase
VLLSLALQCAAAGAGLPVERFVDEPAIAPPKISPNGRFLATPVHEGERSVIAVFDLDAPASKPQVIYTEDLRIEWIEWANDDRLLLSFVTKTSIKLRLPDSYIPRKFGQFEVRRLAAVNRDGTGAVSLMTQDRRVDWNLDLTTIAHMLPDSREHVLIVANDSGGRLSLFRVDIYSGKAEVVIAGNKRTVFWLTDLGGVPRVRWDWNGSREVHELFARRGDGEEWDKIAEFGERDLPDLNIVGFADDPRTAIVTSSQAGDRQSLYEYDLGGRRLGRMLFSHPSVDVGAPFGQLIYDRETTRLLGLTYVEDLWLVHLFDEELKQAQAEADALFAGMAAIRLHSWSKDRMRTIVYTEGPTNPGSFHLYDRRKKAHQLIGRLYPKLVQRELGEIEAIRYRARDGAKLTSYLTLPPGRSGKNLPMVVMPHGGPELRDSIQFDALAQAIANQGYVVFQPNFRGSGGYGRAFAEAGHRQWGRRMQDDITDGVKALVEEGTADPKRICIVGGSYGGYAALAGGAFTPDLYRCVISFAGVSDLVEMVEQERRTAGADSSVYRYWVKLIGDPARDAVEMKAWSPAHNAGKFTAPVLLVHGKEDEVVPSEQSRLMQKALKSAGKPVEFVELKSEGHNFASPSGRLTLLKEIQKFLAQHLGD